MRTIEYVNVETFIVFRASTPVVISLLDYVFLGRALPSARSWMALIGLVAGATLYVYTDASFEVTGYFWLGVW